MFLCVQYFSRVFFPTLLVIIFLEKNTYGKEGFVIPDCSKVLVLEILPKASAYQWQIARIRTNILANIGVYIGYRPTSAL